MKNLLRYVIARTLLTIPMLFILLSIVFVVIVMGADLPHGQTITAVVAWTVILSILAHGMTANPWARAYGARARRAG